MKYWLKFQQHKKADMSAAASSKRIDKRFEIHCIKWAKGEQKQKHKTESKWRPLLQNGMPLPGDYWCKYWRRRGAVVGLRHGPPLTRTQNELHTKYGRFFPLGVSFSLSQ